MSTPLADTLYLASAERDGDDLVLRLRAFDFGALSNLGYLEEVSYVARMNDGHRVRVVHTRHSKSSGGLDRRG